MGYTELHRQKLVEYTSVLGMDDFTGYTELHRQKLVDTPPC